MKKKIFFFTIKTFSYKKQTPSVTYEEIKSCKRDTTGEIIFKTRVLNLPEKIFYKTFWNGFEKLSEKIQCILGIAIVNFRGRCWLNHLEQFTRFYLMKLYISNIIFWKKDFRKFTNNSKKPMSWIMRFSYSSRIWEKLWLS